MKKLLLSGLAILMTAVCAVSGAACNKNALVPDRPLHIWSEDWSHDGVSHWHACTDEGCPGKSDNAYHEYELTSTTKAPTCSKEGEGEWTCKVCGYKKTDVIAKTEHTFTLQSTTKTPTCYQPGAGIYVCSECGYAEEQLISATGEHIFGEKYVYDENYHWHTCTATYGCTATDQKEAHIEGEPSVTQPAVNSWLDGSKKYYCSVCEAYIREEPIYSPMPPASFDLNLLYNDRKVKMEEMEKENGFDCFSVTLVKGRTYNIQLDNAVNFYDQHIVIGEGDIPWDVPTLHGLKCYYVSDRGNEIECEPFNEEGPITFYSTIRFNNLEPAENPLKVILRYETGVNDYNFQNRKIRVTKILYVTCVNE